jgi:poly-gamma-glutamate synthesis protein (capsule biosynthesis protein)
MIATAALLFTACVGDGTAEPVVPPSGPASVTGDAASPNGATVRMLFVGDLMPARGVAPVIEAEGAEVFADVRAAISTADLAFANLEATLADGSEDGLIAPSTTATVLANVGFDVVSIANNHSGDAGPGSVARTAATLVDAGILPIGEAPDGDVLGAAEIRSADPVVLALAVDLTARPEADVVGWQPDAMRDAVATARGLADLVVVSVHGGAELLPRPDPALEAAVELLAGAGADVVWAHGSHVSYPVDLIDPDGDGRPTVAAYGLGNFLFDQGMARTTEGLLLEVVAGSGGVTAFRVGRTNHRDLRVHLDEWLAPRGDAVAFDTEWWAMAAAVEMATQPAVDIDDLGDVVVEASALGSITGDPAGQIVVAFLRDFRPTAVNRQFDEAVWTDADGRSAHVGLFRPGTLEEVWVAGSVAAPVNALAACDGAIAVTYRSLDARATTSAGAWIWADFGFDVNSDLPGAATPGCADVDGDGMMEAVLERGGVVGLYEP